MPHAPSADRNLLFGMLALPLDFIARDDLIAALHAWVLDKSKPVGRLLTEQGNLSADRLALLDALAAEHLRTHGDDPGQSLAALGATADGSLAAVRRSVATPSDADLQGSLAPRIGQHQPGREPEPKRQRGTRHAPPRRFGL
jgi:hypothetical protein